VLAAFVPEEVRRRGAAADELDVDVGVADEDVAQEPPVAVGVVERRVADETGLELEEPRGAIKIRQRRAIGFGTVTKTVFKLYPRRTVLGLALFIGQAFIYNAVFFTYALVLDKFYGVGADQVGWYIAAFAVGNFAGPLLLGRLFDSVGRKPMIAGTYIGSGLLLAVTAILFNSGALTATTQTVAWCVIFFFASAGASAAYLTVSEIFPMETRAMAISFFYAVGTGIGGITGPLLFGKLIDNASASGDITGIAPGYFLGAGLMIAGGIVAAFLGVKAEGQSLETIAQPLTAADAEAGGHQPERANA